ncbi:helix-turn-helix domain-containing protein [Nocardia sp. 2]|uniref:Helix-turn-helix domain-containing protein n=1 Tax=Nocardia acididurans TaxID=2802282 RepID=A0ABS1M0F9_9NOCA|nr:helix-turn-helix transcriptional regulator [Nocardia acididurans]MBL1073669.1 helix-turn-helix domain-containing protein [Nocardia acididurans]
MAEREDGTPPTLLRRQLGRFLREAREGRGLSIANAAKEVQLSFNALQRLETGRTVNPRRQDVRELCSLYEVGDEQSEQAVGLASRAAAAKGESGVTSLGGLFSDAFNMYVSMERAARKMVTYQELVPGLLQTAAYARGLISAFLVDGNHEDIERRVEIRMERQVIVTRKARPLELEILLHESALHRVIGGPKVMARQLRELAEIGKRPNVSLRVHPFSAGTVWGLPATPFVLLDFGTDNRGEPLEPPIVYLDGAMSSDLYIEKRDVVERYHEFSEALRRTALDEMSTRDLLRRAARRFDSEG